MAERPASSTSSAYLAKTKASALTPNCLSSTPVAHASDRTIRKVI